MDLLGIRMRLAGRELFRGLTFTFPEGKVSLLQGSNGAGKTTLLRIVSGVLIPDAGEVRWGAKAGREARRSLGICPAEDGGFYPALTVRQNLEFFASLYGIAKKDVEARVRATSPLPLDFLDLPVERCSLGMRQKAKIARALLHEPEVLLFDEPFNGLDKESRSQLSAWLEKQGRTVLLVQHGLEGDYFRCQLKDGEIRAC